MASTCQTAFVMTVAVVACVLLPCSLRSSAVDAAAAATPGQSIIKCPDLENRDEPVRRLRSSFSELISVTPCGVHMGEVEGLAVYPKDIWVTVFAAASTNLAPQLDRAEYNRSCIGLTQRTFGVNEAVPEEALEGLEPTSVFRQATIPNPSADGAPWVRRVIKVTVQFFGQRGPPTPGAPVTPMAVNEVLGIVLDSRKLMFRLSANVHPNGHGLAPATATPNAEALELLPGQVFSYPLYVTNTRNVPLELGTISRHDTAFSLIMIDPAAYPHSDSAPSPFIVQPMTRSPLLATFLYSSLSESNAVGHIQVTFVKGPMYKLFYNVSVIGNKVPRINLGVLRSADQRLDAPVYFTNPSEAVLSVRDAFVLLPNVSLVPPRTVLFAAAMRNADFDHGDSRTQATLARCITVTPVFGQVLLPATKTLVATVSVLGEACLKAVSGVSPSTGLRRLIGPLGLRLNASAPPHVPDRSFEYRFAVDIVVGDIARFDETPATSSPPVLFAPAIRSPPSRSVFSSTPIALLTPGRIRLALTADLPTTPKLNPRQVSTSAPWLVVVPPANSNEGGSSSAGDDGVSSSSTGVTNIGEATVEVDRVPQAVSNTQEVVLSPLVVGTVSSTLHVPMPGGGSAQLPQDTTVVVAVRPFLLVEQSVAPAKVFDGIVDPTGDNKALAETTQRGLPFSDAWASPFARAMGAVSNCDARHKLRLQGTQTVNGVHLGIVEDDVKQSKPAAARGKAGGSQPPRRPAGDFASAGVLNKTVHFVNVHNFSIAVYGIQLSRDILWSASTAGHGLSLSLLHAGVDGPILLEGRAAKATNGPLVTVRPGGSFAVTVKFVSATVTQAKQVAFGRFAGTIIIDAIIERTAVGAAKTLAQLPKSPTHVPTNAAHSWFGMEVPVSYAYAPRGGDIFFENTGDFTVFPWSRRVVDSRGVLVSITRNITVRSTLPFDVPITSVFAEVLPPLGPNSPKGLVARPPPSISSALTHLHDAFQVNLQRYTIPANSTVVLATVDFYPAYVSLARPDHDAAAAAAADHRDGRVDQDVPLGRIASSLVGANPLMGPLRRAGSASAYPVDYANPAAAVELAAAATTFGGSGGLLHPFGTRVLSEPASTSVPPASHRLLFKITPEVLAFVEKLPTYDTTPDRVITLVQLRAWDERVRSATHHERAAFTISNGGSRWSTLLLGEAGFTRAAIGFASDASVAAASAAAAAVDGNTTSSTAVAAGTTGVDINRFPLHFEADVNFGIHLRPRSTATSRSATGRHYGGRAAASASTKRYIIVSNPARTPITVQPVMLAEATDDSGAPLSMQLRERLRETAERYWDYLHGATGHARPPSPLAADDAWFSVQADAFFLGAEARRPVVVPPGGSAAIGPIHAATDICQRVPAPPGENGGVKDDNDAPRTVYGIVLLRNNDTIFEPIRLHATCGGAPVTLHDAGGLTPKQLSLVITGNAAVPPSTASVNAAVAGEEVNAMATERRGTKGQTPSFSQVWTHLTRPFEIASADGQSRASWAHLWAARLLPEHYSEDKQIAGIVASPEKARRLLGAVQFPIKIMLRNPAGVPVIITDIRVNGARCVPRMADFALTANDAVDATLQARRRGVEAHHGGASSGGWLLPTTCIGGGHGDVLDGTQAPRVGVVLPADVPSVASVVLAPEQVLVVTLLARPDFATASRQGITGTIAVHQQYRLQDVGTPTPGGSSDVFVQTFPVSVSFAVPLGPLAATEPLTAWEAATHHLVNIALVGGACVAVGIAAAFGAKMGGGSGAATTTGGGDGKGAGVGKATTDKPSKPAPKVTTPAPSTTTDPAPTTTKGAAATTAKPVPSTVTSAAAPKKGVEAQPASKPAKAPRVKATLVAHSNGTDGVSNDSGNPLTKQSSGVASSQVSEDAPPQSDSARTSSVSTPKLPPSRPPTPPPSEARAVVPHPDPLPASATAADAALGATGAMPESDDDAAPPPPRTSSTLPPDAKEQLAAVAAASQAAAQTTPTQPSSPVTASPPAAATNVAPSSTQRKKIGGVADRSRPSSPATTVPSATTTPVAVSTPPTQGGGQQQKERPQKPSLNSSTAATGGAAAGRDQRGSRASTPPLSSPSNQRGGAAASRVSPTSTAGRHGAGAAQRTPPAQPRDPAPVSPTLAPRAGHGPLPPTTTTTEQHPLGGKPTASPDATTQPLRNVLPGLVIAGTVRAAASPGTTGATTAPQPPRQQQQQQQPYVVTTTPGGGANGGVQSVVLTFPGKGAPPPPTVISAAAVRSTSPPLPPKNPSPAAPPVRRGQQVVVGTPNSGGAGGESANDNDRVYLSGLLRPNRGPAPPSAVTPAATQQQQQASPQQSGAASSNAAFQQQQPQRPYVDPIAAMMGPQEEKPPVVTSLVGPNTRIGAPAAVPGTAPIVPQPQPGAAMMGHPHQPQGPYVMYPYPMHQHHPSAYVVLPPHIQMHQHQMAAAAAAGMIAPPPQHMGVSVGGMVPQHPQFHQAPHQAPPPPPQPPQQLQSQGGDELQRLLENLRPTGGAAAPAPALAAVKRSLSDRLSEESSPVFTVAAAPPPPPLFSFTAGAAAAAPGAAAPPPHFEFDFATAAGQPGFLEGILDRVTSDDS